MDGIVTANRLTDHGGYYSQIAKLTNALYITEKRFGKETLIKWTKDPSTITLVEWDYLVSNLSQNTEKILRDNGNSLTTSTGVCILKEAGRMIAEEALNETK